MHRKLGPVCQGLLPVRDQDYRDIVSRPIGLNDRLLRCLGRWQCSQDGFRNVESRGAHPDSSILRYQEHVSDQNPMTAHDYKSVRL